MRGLVAACAAFALVAPVAVQSQEVRRERGPTGPVRVQLDAMPMGALVTVLMRDVMKVPYVIAPDVLQDRRPISVNLVMPRAEIPSNVLRFLRGIGLDVELIGGTVYIARRGFQNVGGGGGGPALPGQRIQPSLPSSVQAAQDDPRSVQAQPLAPLPGQAVPGPSLPGRGSPVPGHTPVVPADLAQQTTAGELKAFAEPDPIAIIRPAHREPAEFVDALETALPGLAVAARDASQAREFTIAPARSPEHLVISGPRASLLRAVDLVRALDLPRASVLVRGAIVEVSENETRGSALAILANLLGGVVGINSLGGSIAGDQSLTLSRGGFSAVLSAVREDGRFQVIAEPSISVLSGSVATLNSGAEVPTVGAITYAEGGQPVRSIVYRNSGVTLTVRAVVVRDRVHLTLDQERSSFARTTTGVDDSPTLNATSVQSEFILAPGESVAVAGVQERSSSETKSGLLGGLFGSRRKTRRDSQTVLLLSVEIVEADNRGALDVVFLGLEGMGESDDFGEAFDLEAAE